GSKQGNAPREGTRGTGGGRAWDSVGRGCIRPRPSGVPGMCILPLHPSHASPAAQLPPQARLRLALDALAGVPVRQLASAHHVSRKLVYQPLRRAHAGLQDAFAPPAPPADLLFWLPVTESWLHQLVLALALVCHSSTRGACELLAELFDYPLSVGAVHNILHRAVTVAQPSNAAEDLAAVRIGAHDEIFQGRTPVLVGADVQSSYCYLLSQEGQRDGETLGVRLLELRDRGFAPQATIADFGTGLRAGQQQALPGVPC